jgi:alpha-galactosidase
MRQFIFFLFAIAVALPAISQDVSLAKGWTFRTGDDSTTWAAASLDETGWKPIDAGRPWEAQGFSDYDGFGWYRLHVVIPSSIKERSVLKDSLRLDLGQVGSGDEVYLNGKLIGRNNRRGAFIKNGRRGQRSYLIAANDPALLWDKENVIAVRVWNGNGPGGLLAGDYALNMVDVTDFAALNTDNIYVFNGTSAITKKILLQSNYDNYGYAGKMTVSITDPESGKEIYRKVADAGFSKAKPFELDIKTNLPENKSYLVQYNYTEGKTGKQLSKTETSPYLLTPKAAAKPRINGPDVFGARPQHPFQYKIPASGEKPLQYAVKNLPEGLQLDPATGIITGVVRNKGSYPVKISAKNKQGSAEKDFTIVIGDKIGLTPALGWNSWNAWGLSVSDEKVRISAKAMADHLIDHGWTYINIDDGWEAPERTATGELPPNAKFPDMKKLTDYIHGLGLKMGIYSSPGPRTCGGYLGSYQHEEQDAKMFADWGIDYLKYDWCSYSQIAPPNPDLNELKKPYVVMRGALDKVNRDIIYSLCQYGWGDVWKWGAEVGGNSWRTTGDITDTWMSLSRIGFAQDKASPYAEPGAFNDPDMLVVGKVGWGPRLRNSRLTADEQYTHISLWSLLASPLLIGCDMGQLDDFTLNLLTNDEVLSIGQDALGKQAFKIMDKDSTQVWVKELKDGSKAVGIFNLSNTAKKQTINFADIQLNSQVKLRDVWRQKDLGSASNSFAATIPSHGVVLLKASKN